MASCLKILKRPVQIVKDLSLYRILPIVVFVLSVLAKYGAKHLHGQQTDITVRLIDLKQPADRVTSRCLFSMSEEQNPSNIVHSAVLQAD